jgi:hypothetical protein
MVRSLISVIVGLILASAAQATTTNVATTLAFNDVSNAVYFCSPGDLALLPPGDITWSNNEGLVVNKRIRFYGSGSANTIIRRGSGANSATLFTFSGLGTGNSSNLLVDIAYFTIETINSPWGSMAIGTGSETNRNFRVHDLIFTNIQNRGIIFFGHPEGLCDHVLLQSTVNSSVQGITVYGAVRHGYQNSSTAYQIGVFPDTLYIEDCGWDFKWRNDAGYDGYFDTKFVVRHCWFTNTTWWSHHNEPTDPQDPGKRGLRCAAVEEFYNNFLMNTATNSAAENKLDRLSQFRAGWGVCFSNDAHSLVVDCDNKLTITEYRSTGTNVFTYLNVTNVAIASGGSGYSVNDLLTIQPGNFEAYVAHADLEAAGTDAKVKVTSVDGNGAITGLTITTNGIYDTSWNTNAPDQLPPPTWVVNTLFSTNNPPSGGTGSNALLNLTYYPFAPYFCISGTNCYDGNRNTSTNPANYDYGYPGLDMVGWGDPIIWVPNTINPTGTVQTFYGLYAWSNTCNGTNNPIEVQQWGTTARQINNYGVYGVNGITLPTSTNMLIAGRDYFDGIPKPGYTPAPYPHPLQIGGAVAPPDPLITANPVNATVTRGQPATFSVTATGTLPLHYQWTQNGTNLAGATTNSYTLSSASMTNNGYTYACRVSNSVGTALSSTATLTVFALNIARSGGSVVVSWPATLTDSLLQTSDLAGGLWTTNSGYVSISGTNVLTIRPPVGNSFFRLGND